jgi:signal transduction histidine kinase
MAATSVVDSSAAAAARLRLRSEANRVTGEICDGGAGFEWERVRLVRVRGLGASPLEGGVAG